MACKRQCDKCGTIYDIYEHKASSIEVEVFIKGATIGEIERVDLCKDCTEKMKKWLKEK